MADLVRVRLENGVEKNLGAAFAERLGLKVLDEPTRRPDGSLRGETRAGGRRPKPKTSVDQLVAEKKATDLDATAGPTPASIEGSGSDRSHLS